MPTASSRALSVAYSMLSTEAVAGLIVARYDLPEPVEVKLFRRGFNDTFQVRARDGQRAMFRISGWRARGGADIGSETEFLAHLHRAGLPVAPPLPLRDGGLFSSVTLPEAIKPAVLFQYIEGRLPADYSKADCHAQGVTLARIHTEAENFENWNSGRYRLDLDHLLHRPVEAILALGVLDQELWTQLKETAARLAAAVTNTEPLTWTRCHGDCHGHNAHIALEGRHEGQAVFFDFDDGGPGYLAYDLAVFLWAVTLHAPSIDPWHAFVDGYRSVRPLASADFEAVPLFVPIRHFWLMGEFASRTTEWGSEAASAGWLERQIRFIQSWEREKLSPSLF